MLYMNWLLLRLTTITVTIVVTQHFIDLIGFFLLNKQKNKRPLFPSSLYFLRIFNILRFPLTYRQKIRRIFHIGFFTSIFQFFPCIFIHSTTHSCYLWYLFILNNGTFSHFCVYIYFLPRPSDVNSTLLIHTKYVVSKVCKLCSLSWFCREIYPPLICWTIFDMYILFFNLICHKSSEYSAPGLYY